MGNANVARIEAVERLDLFKMHYLYSKHEFGFMKVAISSNLQEIEIWRDPSDIFSFEKKKLHYMPIHEIEVCKVCGFVRSVHLDAHVPIEVGLLQQEMAKVNSQFGQKMGVPLDVIFEVNKLIFDEFGPTAALGYRQLAEAAHWQLPK